MRSTTSSSPARRDRRHAQQRTRRRPALVAAGVALGIATTVGFTSVVPVSEASASGTLGGFALASYSTPAPSPTDAANADTDAASTEATDALTRAEASVASARTVVADIASSGLDIGQPDTSVDTAALEAAAQRLDMATRLVEPLVPDLTDDVTDLAASVDERVAGLRGSLDAAIALKAEQEAAEKARQEAEAAAAAAAEQEAAEKAAAQQKSSSSSSSSSAPVYVASGGGSGDNSPAGAQATARGMLAGYGWGDDQFSCLVSLWNKESGWNYQAYNRSSGAYGIPQALPGSKMASAGADWQSNAATQISWGLGYISGRYGTPCGAWGHSQSTGWY